mgnify:CR=1 FL=1
MSWAVKNEKISLSSRMVEAVITAIYYLTWHINGVATVALIRIVIWIVRRGYISTRCLYHRHVTRCKWTGATRISWYSRGPTWAVCEIISDMHTYIIIIIYYVGDTPVQYIRIRYVYYNRYDTGGKRRDGGILSLWYWKHY